MNKSGNFLVWEHDRLLSIDEELEAEYKEKDELSLIRQIEFLESEIEHETGFKINHYSNKQYERMK